MIQLEHTYADLPDEFYHEVVPTAAVSPTLLAVNRPLAKELGLDLQGADDEQLAELFSGRSMPEGARPIAMAYAGHQFGGFSPQLGDGRAILLGEVVSPEGRRFDIHLKGAGQTPFSRRGDGRSSLGPVIREYLVSEAMHALGVPSTRALAAVTTGETVYRERPLPGGVLARVASSHVRVGTFEYFAARRRTDLVKRLADYVIERHYPELAQADNPYLALFEAVARRKLALVARWMGVGFIHGVMNTDNTSVAGETIDFGPCAFMDTFRADQVYSSIDHQGRYRYRNQGPIAMWNLTVLANCLVPILGDDQKAAVGTLNAVLEGLPEFFDGEWLRVMGAKLGLFEPTQDDQPLIERWLKRLETADLDFTNSFRSLSAEFELDTPFHTAWRSRLAEQPQTRDETSTLMRSSNPAFIPRNHQVERAIAGALDGDLSHFRRLHDVLSKPYKDQPDQADLALPPETHEIVHQTFCGT